MSNRFNWQSFISIGLLLSFIIMLFSGIILYIAPEGSLSRWIGWDILNLTKKQWEQQHTIFSYLFILFTVFHLFKINWVYFISYFVIEKLKFKFLKEITVALLITILVFIGTFNSWIPFKNIIDWGKDISDSYIIGVELTGIPDAEKLTMEEFANQVFHISYQRMVEELSDYNLSNTSKTTIVSEFCKINKITPEEFYLKLKSRILIGGSISYFNLSSSNSFFDQTITIL